MKRKIKKVLAPLFAALAVAAVSVIPARAAEDNRVDLLLELLQQKGVITADEAVDLKVAVDAPAPAARVSPGYAPALAPSVNIKGHLKLQAQFIENDAAVNVDTYRIRQARLEFSGDPAPGYKWKVSLAAERTDPTLLDAFIAYDYSQNLNLQVGQFKLPISRESLTSGKSLDLMERAWMLDRFRGANARDIGMKLTFKPIDDWQAEIGAFHGNGKNSRDSNDQKVLAGRVSGTYNAGDLVLQPEIAYVTGPSENAGSPPFEQSLMNTAGFAPYDKTQRQMGLVAMYGLYTAKYEFMQGRYRPQDPAIGNTVIAEGYYAQIGRIITPKLTAFLRYEDFDEDKATQTAGDVNWTTFGLKYSHTKSLSYKLNYTWKKEEVTAVDNDVLGLEMQMVY